MHHDQSSVGDQFAQMGTGLIRIRNDSVNQNGPDFQSIREFLEAPDDLFAVSCGVCVISTGTLLEGSVLLLGGFSPRPSGFLPLQTSLKHICVISSTTTTTTIIVNIITVLLTLSSS